VKARQRQCDLAIRPSSIPLTDRFPAKYAVNTIPYTIDRQQAPRQRQPRKSQNSGAMDRNRRENPNQIQISRNRPREEGELPEGGERWQANTGTRIENTDENNPFAPSTC